MKFLWILILVLTLGVAQTGTLSASLQHNSSLIQEPTILTQNSNIDSKLDILGHHDETKKKGVVLGTFSLLSIYSFFLPFYGVFLPFSVLSSAIGTLGYESFFVGYLSLSPELQQQYSPLAAALSASLLLYSVVQLKFIHEVEELAKVNSRVFYKAGLLLKNINYSMQVPIEDLKKKRLLEREAKANRQQ